MSGVDTIRERLWHGETLSLRFGEGMGFDVWIEKYGSPPQVFFEGRPHPMEELDDILEQVAGYLDQPGVRVQWNAEIPHHW